MLLERERESILIDELVEAAVAGNGRLGLIEGPPGIGKTALLQAARDRAKKRGFTVLMARGSPLEGEFGFGVVRQLLDGELARRTAERRRRLFEGAAGLAAPLLGYEASGTTTSGVAVAETTTTADPYGLLYGLYWLIMGLAEQCPVLVCVDDAHWADAASLRLIAFVAHRLEGTQVAMLVATRSADGAMDDPALAGLGIEARTTLIRPDPLSPTAVASLVRTWWYSYASDELCQACHTASAGNPFLVRELAVGLAADGVEPDTVSADRISRLRPEAISRFVLARLRTLGDAAARLTAALAVLGPSAATSDVVALARLSPDEAAESLARLQGADLLAGTTQLDFRHPVIAGVVEDAIPPTERPAMHLEAARLLHERGANSERICSHLLSADANAEGWVVEQLRRGSEAALGRGTPEAAVAYLRRALAEPPDEEETPVILRELGQAEMALGDPGAISRLSQALERAHSPIEQVRCAQALLDSLGVLGRMDLGTWAPKIEAVIDAVFGAEPELADRLQASLLVYSVAGSPADCRTLTQRWTNALAAEQSRSRSRSPALLALEALSQATAGGSCELAVRLAQTALSTGDLLADAIPMSSAIVTLMVCERFEPAIDWIERAVQRYRERGSTSLVAGALGWRATISLRRGVLTQAELDAALALQLSESQGQDRWIGRNAAVLALALAEQDRLTEAASVLERLRPDLPVPNIVMADLTLYIRAQARAHLDDTDGALTDLLDFAAREEERGPINPAWAPWRSTAALLQLKLGHPDRAQSLVEPELALASAFGAPGALGAARQVAALIAEAQGERTSAIEQLQDAVELLQISGEQLHLARAFADLGGALRRAGRKTEALVPLRTALDIADRCNAQTLARQTRHQLVAAGAKPRRQRLTGAEALTASERRIAEMAAAGRTNREIAQALFITADTVAKHLSHSYQKLGIDSRDRLGEMLG